MWPEGPMTGTSGFAGIWLAMSWCCAAVAQLSKLEAETAVDYAVSVVRYNDTRIARLTKHLATHQGVSNE